MEIFSCLYNSVTGTYIYTRIAPIWKYLAVCITVGQAHIYTRTAPIWNYLAVCITVGQVHIFIPVQLQYGNI